ncbi:DegT/DnrJ/EryC1/StrS family aminotransferase [Zhihengliuella sp. ISTPL4]|uniref:DegT/DnrJ/EryC1/StrS family aminotransferase n=1 Tax=Zhihengliuella sp. ISTPL4 TaxID=2058657 RepID=UPI000C7BCB1F|nr:DegT/DnrJ/EryC1/StrS family aminotransferase [Zhihengliuella sp. ISTPL4]
MIPVSEPDLGALERSYLLDAFDSGWISSRGAYVERAEDLLRTLTAAPHAAVCSNGTTALHLALLAAGVGEGDEVIIPALTYVATLNAVYYVQAVPVVVDVLDSTWCIDPAAVERAITPQTTAIVAVDLYGQTADYRELRRIADEHGLILIADAAESLGATLDGRAAGSLADISTFSFFGNKVITSGEGGAVTTPRADFHTAILQLRNQGNHPTRRYFHDIVGYNYRMTNVAAAILTAQLERASELIAQRRRVVDEYERLLAADERLRGQEIAAGAAPTPWIHSVRLTGRSAVERDAVITALAERGIESRPVFPLVQDMPFVPAAQRTPTPVAAAISREGISLPTFPRLEASAIAQVCQALRDVLSSFADGE